MQEGRLRPGVLNAENRRRFDAPPGVWIASDGREFRFADMSDLYLLRTANWLLRYARERLCSVGLTLVSHEDGDAVAEEFFRAAERVGSIVAHANLRKLREAVAEVQRRNLDCIDPTCVWQYQGGRG